MRKTAFLVFVTLAVLAAAACTDNPTGPIANSNSTGLAGKASTNTAAKINAEFIGTWRATKAEAWGAARGGRELDIRRELVAEGGTIILVLEQGGTYSVSVAMPGKGTGVQTGRWHYHEFWGKPQIDFYISEMPNLEWGEIPSFYVTLSNDALTLWDGSSRFLPYDFGWIGGVLALEFTRM